MKRFNAWIAAALLAGTAAAPMAPASATKTDNEGANAAVHEFCTDLIASGAFDTLNYGECVSFNVVSEQGFKAHFCDYIRENEDYADWGFTSYSDCVRNISF